MPSIPTFVSTESYDAAPLPQENPAIAAQPGQALAQGMDRVEAAFSEVNQRVVHQAAASQAAAIDADAANKISDLQEKYSHDPDPATAPQRFRAEAEALHQSTLDGIGNPLVSTYVNQTLTRRLPVAYAEVNRASTGQVRQQAVGTAQSAVSTQATGLGSANTQAEQLLAVQGIKQAAASVVTTGSVTPEQGLSMVSGAIRTGILQKSVSDPLGAAAMLDQWKGDLTAQDLLLVSDHLRTAVNRRTADDAAASAVGMSVPGVTAPAAPASVQPGAAPGAPQPGATAPPMPAAQQARAQAVHDGMMARGYTDAQAWGWAANALHESGGDPSQVTKGDGTDGSDSVGVFQWNGPRAAAFKAQYGVAPNQATLDQQLDFAAAETKGSEKAAGDRIMAAPNTPADAARVISTAFLRPGSTAINERDRAATATRLAANGQPAATQPPGMPDLATAIDRVRTATAGQTSEVQQLALARTVETWHHLDAGFAVQRAGVASDARDLTAAYESGNTEMDPSSVVQRIRAVYPPSQGDRLIENLAVSRDAGDKFRAVRWATPDEEQALLASTAVPGSMSATGVRRVGKTGDTEPALPDDGTVTETPDVMAHRLAVFGKLQQLVLQKHQALMADPAGYVAGSPALAGVLKAAQDGKGDPDANAAYVNASLALQSKLGVPEAQQHALTVSQAQNMAATITGADPAKTDVGPLITQTLQSYGDAGRKVWGDLVTTGKLPADYMLLANMNDPAARADFQRVLTAERGPGGAAKVKDAAPSDAVKYIDQNVDAEVADFNRTAALPGVVANTDLISNMKSGVKRLAYQYATAGQDPSTALANATKALIGNQYDFADTMRVPKGPNQPTLAMVEDATGAAQKALTAGDLMPMAGGADLTPEQRQAVTLKAAQRGKWFPNEADNGLFLVAPLPNGAWLPVRRADGSRVEMKFSDVPRATASPPASGRVAGADLSMAP